MKTKASARPVLTVLAIWSFVFFALFVMSACEEQPRAVCAFKIAEMARSRVSGQIGQVVWRSTRYSPIRCVYNIRFAANQAQTQVNLLSPDGAVETRPLALVLHLEEYELEKVE